MHLREDMIEQYLSSDGPDSFKLKHLESDLLATETLRQSYVIGCWCYRSGVHEFLLFQLESRTKNKKFWMRLDRMPQLVRNAFRVSQQTAPAHDTYCLNYDKDVLTAGEDRKMKLIEALTQLSQELSMWRIVSLMNIIRNVSGTWELLGTNCRWFCAVTLDSLQCHFGGKWMISEAAFRGGIGKFRGFDEMATKRVRELYQPWFQPEQNSGMPSAIARATVVPLVFAGSSARGGHTGPATTPNNEDERMSFEETPTPRQRVRQPPEIGYSGRLDSVVSGLINLGGPEPSKEDLERELLRLPIFATPEAIWGCFRGYSISSQGEVADMQNQRVLELSRIWIHCWRLPSKILAEIGAMSERFSNTPSLLALARASQELSAELSSITIFGRHERPEPGQQTSGDILGISPERTASILRLMEVEIRSRYLKAEIVALHYWHCDSQSTTDSIQRILPFSEMVIIWVKVCFVSAQDSRKRIEVFNYFDHTARECYRRRNYATTTSIVNALQELDIRSLKVTYKQLGEKAIKAMEKLGSESSKQHWSASAAQRSSPPVWPFELSARLETIQRIKALKTNLHEVPDTGDLMSRILSMDTMKRHGMKPEQVNPEHLACSSLVLSSIEDGCRRWDRLKDRSYLIQIQAKERAERDRIRSNTIF